MTQGLIFEFFSNYVMGLISGQIPIASKRDENNNILEILEYLADYYLQQNMWIKEQIDTNHSDEPYWQNVALMEKQLDGLYDGYNSQAPELEQFERFEIWIANGIGDLPDLITAAASQSLQKYYNPNFNLKLPLMKPALARKILQRYVNDSDLETLASQGTWPSFKTKYLHMTASESFKYAHQNSLHCSGLVKWTSKKDELYFSHDTWSSYFSMIRIFKEYKLNLANPSVRAKRVLFSSYPGILDSVDDFYVTDQNLVIFETTNDIFNLTLYNYLQPQSLFSSVRAMIACRMAQTSSDWTHVFAQYNSGTYSKFCCSIS